MKHADRDGAQAVQGRAESTGQANDLRFGAAESLLAMADDD